MHGKNLLSDKDRPICSLLGVPLVSRNACAGVETSNISSYFQENNAFIEQDKFKTSDFASQSRSRPDLLRLDSTGETVDSKDQCGIMAPQNPSNSGVEYITQTRQQQQRFDRSPVRTHGGNRRFHRGHNPPNHNQRRQRFPGNTRLLSNMSSYNSQSCMPFQPNADYSRTGYPFHNFNRFNFPAYLPNPVMMPLGTSHFRAPVPGFGYLPNCAYPPPHYYRPPQNFVHVPQGCPHPSLLYQAYPFMPRRMAGYSQNTSPRPRERSRAKRRVKKPRRNDVLDISESLQKESVGQEGNSELKKPSCISSIVAEGTSKSPCNGDKSEVSDEILSAQSVEIEKVPKSYEDCIKKGIENDRNSVTGCSNSIVSCVRKCSDEISMQSDSNNLDNDRCFTQVSSGLHVYGNFDESLECTCTCSDLVTHSNTNNDSKIGAQDFEEKAVDSPGDVDSGYYDNQDMQNEQVPGEILLDEQEKIKEPEFEDLARGLVSLEIVSDDCRTGTNSATEATAGSGATSESENDVGAYDIKIYDTEDAAEISVSDEVESDVAHFSLHVTELEHFDKSDNSQCHEDCEDDKAEQEEARVPSPQGQSVTSSAIGAKQKKKGRPSAKKRKRMRQKRETFNVSIRDISPRSSTNNSGTEVNDKEDADAKESPSRGCVGTVSFIVGADSDNDDFDIEFVRSPCHSPPKSCPKLQFDLLSSDTENEAASASDSDFESDDNCSWGEDLLDSFCIRDPYSPFSIQLQCTSIPVKKSASSPELSPPNAFAFDVTIKRSLDPNRRRVSFAVEETLTKVIEEEEALADAFQEARKGPWEEMARDRHRFQRRIADVESNISYVFQPGHRRRIYDRFYADNTSD